MWKIHPFVAPDTPAAHLRSFPTPLTGNVPLPSAAEPAPAPVRVAAPAPAPFTFRLALGLIGVLVAVLVSGFNDHVIDVELADIRGAMGIGHDEGTWLTALYEAFEVSAM